MKKVFLAIKEFKLSFLFFFLFIFLIYFFFYFNKEQEIKKINTDIIQTYNTQYNITYENFKKISQNTFFGIINKPEIYNLIKNSLNKNPKEQDYYRKKLYERFLPDYIRLRELNFNQIHFHTKDNKSYLRMHNPEIFGDDISKIRKSVVLTNKILKPTEGLEIGRALLGFRFVYPIFDDKLVHLGSVEVSVASKYFERTYEDNYNVDVHILLKKSVVQEKIFKSENKNIIKSEENDDYILIKEDRKENLHFSNQNFYTKNEKTYIQNKMNNTESFVINKNNLVIYFKNIKNLENTQNSAYIVLYTKSNHLKEIDFIYKMEAFALFLSIIIFLFIINYMYTIKLQEEEEKKINNQRTKLISMGEMINNIAHQWRQPLSIISTAASGIQLQNEYGSLEKTTINDSMNLIVEQTQNLSQTIEDFRNFNLENTRKEPFSIKKIILETINVFEINLSQQNITLITNIEDELIVSYPDNFKQMLIILIKNAIDVIKNDGLILIKSENIGERIKITIQDSGGGIKKENLARIFEPYYTTKNKNIGIGVGLFTVFEIITKKLNGTIHVKNTVFNYKFKNYTGALFTINLKRKNQ